MEADAGSDWKIVFYFVTIDLEALLKASKQFADQWNKCVLDIQRSNLYCFVWSFIVVSCFVMWSIQFSS